MNKKILIIEDAPKIRKQLRDIFETEDFEVFSAENGIIGIEEAKKHLPDIIISDIMMPEADGFQVFNQLKRHYLTSTIPFIFLSAKSDKSDIREGMNLGVDDYLTKPFDPDELINLVNIRLEKSELIKNELNSKLENLSIKIMSYLPNNIKKNINSVIGLGEVLIEKYDNLNSNQKKEMLSQIRISGEQLHNVFENYYQLIKLEIESNTENFPENEIIINEEFIVREKDLINYFSNIEVEITQDIKLSRISDNLLYKLIKEIIINSCLYSPANSTKFVKAFTKENDFIFIVINDVNSNFDINNFMSYYQSNNQNLSDMDGLGLITIKKIIKRFNGKIDFKFDNSKKILEVICSIPFLNKTD